MTAEKRSIYLITVLEVPKADRVLCQAQGCGHAVYKRIHVIHDDGAIKVVGSECFKRLYGDLPAAASTPRFGSSEGRLLSAEERDALVNNTAALVAMLETEHDDVERARHVREGAVRATALRLQDERAVRGTTAFARPGAAMAGRPQPDLPAAEMAKLREQAKERLRAIHPGVDLDSPGYIGLVTLEVRKLLREMSRAGSQSG